MTEIKLNQGEVAQCHFRLYRIQRLARKASSTDIYNQARMLINMIGKAERRHAREAGKGGAL